MIRNVVIIGSGPAGLTAAIYTGRAKLKPLVIEGDNPGGQLMTTTAVENWPGIKSVQGPDLMIDMKAHAAACGTEFLADSVTEVDFSQRPYKLTTKRGKVIEAQSVIVACGASHRKLHCPGEAEYWSKGVTVCATCDAPFYKGKEVLIVGGGNTAMTEADYLKRFAKKVTVVHILDKFTATDPIKDRVLDDDAIEKIYSSTVIEFKGDGNRLTSVIIENQKTKEKTEKKFDGVFIAIGLKPNTSLFEGQLPLDKYGYIQITEKTCTEKEGVFVAGDVADYRYKQAVTSSGDGCKAALDCEYFLTGSVTVVYSK